MGSIEALITLVSGVGASGLLGMAWNLRNAWKATMSEAIANERRHREAMAELRQSHAVQAAILSALVERMDRAEIRADRIEQDMKVLFTRKD